MKAVDLVQVLMASHFDWLLVATKRNASDIDYPDQCCAGRCRLNSGNMYVDLYILHIILYLKCLLTVSEC